MTAGDQILNVADMVRADRAAAGLRDDGGACHPRPEPARPGGGARHAGGDRHRLHRRHCAETGFHLYIDIAMALGSSASGHDRLCALRAGDGGQGEGGVPKPGVAKTGKVKQTSVTGRKAK